MQPFPIIGYTRKGQPVYPIAGGAVNDVITRSDTGSLMPEEYSREIIQSTVRYSAALQLFRKIQVGRAQHRIPALAAFPAAYWVTGGDTGLKQSTKILWNNKYINIAELAVIVPIPENVFADSAYDVWAEVFPRVSEAMGEKIDQAIFFGGDIPAEWVGENGIVPDAITAGNVVTAGTGQDLGIDISNAMGLVEDDGFDVNGFAGPRRLKARLRNIRSSGSGEPIFQLLGSSSPGTIYGENYAIISNGAWNPDDALAVLGDYTQGIIGMRQDMTYKVFTEGVVTDDQGVVILNLMQQDAFALRAVMRLGYVTANPITRQKPDYTDTSRFPFGVVLDGS